MEVPQRARSLVVKSEQAMTSVSLLLDRTPQKLTTVARSKAPPTILGSQPPQRVKTPARGQWVQQLKLQNKPLVYILFF